jgi:hypothetical protein
LPPCDSHSAGLGHEDSVSASHSELLPAAWRHLSHTGEDSPASWPASFPSPLPREPWTQVTPRRQIGIRTMNLDRPTFQSGFSLLTAISICKPQVISFYLRNDSTNPLHTDAVMMRLRNSSKSLTKGSAHDHF